MASMQNLSLDEQAVLRPASGYPWTRACSKSEIPAPLEQFLEITNLLLEQVQLNSTHLFRADILEDSTGLLQTTKEKEAACSARNANTALSDNHIANETTSYSCAPTFEHFEHRRTVVRRLIPRKPRLDKPLKQSCFIYHTKSSDEEHHMQALVVYVPHCFSAGDMPWYHPKIKALAYLYSYAPKTKAATLFVHYLPFPDTPTPLPDRLSRTFRSLLSTMVRLLKLSSKMTNSPDTVVIDKDILNRPLTAASLKDTILPQHIVQDTYTRLKETYASDLMERWVEKTEPSKHVFEDLSIAAFLIELWSTMYTDNDFPGFVDVACGNGVLTYILVKEGFRGYGFDARRRKTWEVLGIQDHLEEKICIPRPFLDVLNEESLRAEMVAHDGIFPAGTFIISNHADELTCWTPFLAALSCPGNPLPLLAIPCCSHALDGSKHRYTLKEVAVSRDNAATSTNGNAHNEEETLQPDAGDLKAMRVAKQKANVYGDDKSMYACLTRKTAALAQEVRCDIELTLMRIPSTRNIGLVGNRKSATIPDTEALRGAMRDMSLHDHKDSKTGLDLIGEVLKRECNTTGGVLASAKTWVEKARKLQGGQGRGKINLHGPRQLDEHVEHSILGSGS